MTAAEEQLIRIDHTSSLRAMINSSLHKYDRKHLCPSPVIDPETSAAPETLAPLDSSALWGRSQETAVKRGVHEACQSRPRWGARKGQTWFGSEREKLLQLAAASTDSVVAPGSTRWR